MTLTDEQRRAVRSWGKGDVCVVAGPGSGKTRVLVERVRWLVLERNVAPERILAITFTEKAAQEMQSRLLRPKTSSAEDRARLQDVQVSTIDGFCHRLLRENALEAGVDPGFEILDEREAANLLHESIDRVLERRFARGGAPLNQFLSSFAPQADVTGGGHEVHGAIADLVRSLRSYDHRPSLSKPRLPSADLTAALDSLATALGDDALGGLARRMGGLHEDDTEGLGQTLAAVRKEVKHRQARGRHKDLIKSIRDDLLPQCEAAAVSLHNLPAREWLVGTVSQALRSFAAAKLTAGRMDFQDLLAHGATLLATSRAPRVRYEHVLVDEFQDTNPLQIRLLEHLVEAHDEDQRPVRFVVGDQNQSIYSFRHADQGVFRDYREGVEEAGGEVIHLTSNFRSRPEILDMVGVVLPGDADGGIEAHELTSGYSFPQKVEPSCEVHVSADGGAFAVQLEAAWIAERLHTLRKELRLADRKGPPGAVRAVEWEDIAILVQTHRKCEEIAAELRRWAIPCGTSGGRGLFDAPETVEVAAFLRVLRNPWDEISLAAVLKSAFCGVSDATLLRSKRDGGSLKAILEESSRGGLAGVGGEEARIARFSRVFSECRADRATVPVRHLLSRALSDSGYRGWLAQRPDATRSMHNLDRLLDWIGRRAESGARSLDALCEALDRELEAPLPERQSSRPAGSRHGVDVLTMHGAKGLEYPVVVLASLQTPQKVSSNRVIFSEAHGIGARWKEPFGAPTEDAACRSAKREIRALAKEERDRLLYVAMTRAEEHLLLSQTFRAKPTRSGYSGAVFKRLDIDPKDLPDGEPGVQGVGNLRRWQRYANIGPRPTGPEPGVVTLPTPKLLRPLAPSAQEDFVAAVTSVTEFHDCPRRYFLQRYLGIAPESNAGADAQAQGTSRGRSPTPKAGAAFGDEVHRYLAGELKGPVREDVRRLARRFERHELGRRVERAHRVDREMAFVFAIERFMLRGTIDLLFDEGGQTVLVDYKTDQVPRGAASRAAARHAPQLQLYAAGLARSGRPADTAVVFFLRTGMPVEVDISQSALDRAAGMVTSFFEAQWRQEYPPCRSPHCVQCRQVQPASPA